MLRFALTLLLLEFTFRISFQRLFMLAAYSLKHFLIAGLRHT